jgi:DNA-binding CsgD family transcriptional regulator
MSNTKQTAAIAHFRLICTLGLPSESLVPAIGEALQALIGFSTFGVQWVDSEGSLEGIWFDQALNPAIVRSYTDHFIDTRTMAHWGGLSNLVRRRGAQLLPDWGAAFYRTEYYDAIWRPLGFHLALGATVYTGFTPVGRSILTLYRGMHEPAFRQGDVDKLNQAIPYLAHAFASNDEKNAQYVDTGEEGLLVVDRGGAIQLASRCATNLLFYGSGANRSACGCSPQDMAQELVRRIVASLDASSSPVAPPALYIDNAFGRFTFRAHWFDGRRELVGISLRRQEPLTLRLARASKHLPLSPTQKRILMYAAQQASNAEIGARLSIRPDTVKGHMAAVLDRLGIHDRNKIAEAVLQHAQQLAQVPA